MERVKLRHDFQASYLNGKLLSVQTCASDSVVPYPFLGMQAQVIFAQHEVLRLNLPEAGIHHIDPPLHPLQVVPQEQQQALLEFLGHLRLVAKV